MREVILLSILPEWVEAILTGKKKWEYRKVIPRKIQTGSRVILYASRKERKIVGEFIVGVILKEPVKNLVELTIHETPHTKEEIYSYFSNSEFGYALEVREYKKYKEPIPLTEIRKRIPSFNPPQNFLYLREDDPKYRLLLELLPLST